ncbi:MAG: signal recognition particle-docking protein FtsY [Bacteroidota bacterium]|nr:signal recognition particle-docking protein FtsY [Bacteroidota bacterium]
MSIFDLFKKNKTENIKQENDVSNKGIEKTKESIFAKLSKSIAGKSSIDASFLDELEEILVTSDVGISTTLKIIERVEQRVKKDKYINTNELHTLLRDEIAILLTENKKTLDFDFQLTNMPKPFVLMVVGVNGVGKTTTIGKLAHQFVKNGKKVLLAAGDTFRAGAVDQLEIWSQRVGCGFFAKGMNTDPSAVAFEALQIAKNEQYDIVIVDTAGRLHNKVNLMNELSKIKRVMTKVIEGAPNDVMLVLDASTGQNAFEQAKHFTSATEVSSLALTKLDGTAKGGVVIGISDQFQIPVRFIGVGEGIEDIRLFNPSEFVNSLFEV